MSAPETDLAAMLDTLCPMHAILSPTGHVRHAGPTLTKILGDPPVTGRRFLELFELLRPSVPASMTSLCGIAGQRLHLRLRADPRSEMKGVLMPLPGGPDGALVVNLSFGLSVVDAVRNYALSNADFAATDLTVEMLYLVEAKSAAMEASRKLNLRLQGAKIAAEAQAYTDTLTGLNNRRALEPVMSRLIEAGEDFALMHLDLDHFKSVNDTMGHAAGDHVLETVARILRDETRAGDTIIRVGGDEFVLIFAPLIRPGNLGDIAARLIRRLEEPIVFRDRICRISASLGSTLSRDYDDPRIEAMMEDADIALYAAKDGGRGRHVAYAPALRARAGAHVAQRRQQV
ncbi:diguanylate cyclase domain-containing protein [Roseovarius aestuariivivens]|uniref:diguanylate cyclase domain-containing protein n=1 Tax=Roseovarius aestuariivivens TaxID=1888910 RepID=UPI0010811D90|nr:diguanylate cyclase [Roseovarius aestuariivivens]